jgi:hypothetical protein
MKRYCSTGQSPQWAVAQEEEEEEEEGEGKGEGRRRRGRKKKKQAYSWALHVKEQACQKIKLT